MSTLFIAPIAAVQEPSLAPMQAIAGASGGPGMPAESLGRGATSTTSFSGMVSSGLQQVSAQLQTSQADLQTLATGNVENLHQVMLRLEESRMSFQLMLQVRNRLLESYQDLMRMQV